MPPKSRGDKPKESEVFQYFKLGSHLKITWILNHIKNTTESLPYLFGYKQGFLLSRMNPNNKISHTKLCCDINFTFPKQSQRSRSILHDGSRFLALVFEGKTSVFLPKKYGNITSSCYAKAEVHADADTSLTTFLPMPLRHFVENAVCQKRSHAPTLTLTQTNCGLNVSLGDYYFTE